MCVQTYCKHTLAGQTRKNGRTLCAGSATAKRCDGNVTKRPAAYADIGRVQGDPRVLRFVAVPCGHHFCGHANCHSSQIAECPTCRTPLTGRTELFGACSWLADMFESIDAAASASSCQDGSAVGAAAAHALSTDDLEVVETAIRGAETVCKLRLSWLAPG